jgi:hypothetical protein
VRKANTAWAWALPAAVVLALALGSWSAPRLMAQAGTQGQWRTLINQLQINPIHVALMNNGRVLIVSGSGNVATETNFQSAVWDPASETFQPRPLTAWDMFCNGMVVLHDGRVFINGGNLRYDPFYGEPRNAVYDPATGVFTDVESMAHGRWYPTTTTLGDGSVMTFSGLRETGGTNTSVEIYTVGSGWSAEFPAGWTPPLYPRMHLSTDGRVFYAGSTRSSRFFNPSTKTWSAIVATTNYTGSRSYGTSVLLPLTPANGYRPRVMIFGGGNPATATTEIIDLSAATPVWQFGPSMSQPRIQMNATILPNGRVLATGGSRNDEDAVTASLNADIYNPVTNTFSSGGANVHPRLYHSNSLLLPDATVLLIGGNPQRGNYERRLEIYSPAYLFNADGTAAARPTITGVTPGTVDYGASFQVQTPNAASIASVVLVRPGAPTHAFDMEQRLVGLSYTVGSGVLTVTSPPNGNIAPPGYYMLFVLNTAGVPSVARFVRLTTSAPNQAPVATITSPAANVTLNPGGTVSYSGTGSDPDGTISAYAWTFPGGAPASSSVASPGNVTYSTPGTYVASFRVTDNQGLASPPRTRTITVSGPVGTGTGLVGEYFNDPNNGSHFVTLVRGRLDPTVNFDWATTAPAAGVSVDNFSVRWTGQVQAPVSGNYTFTTSADDGVRLWVGGQLLIDNWVDQAVTTRTSVPVALAAGSRYDVRMEYYEHGGLATARLLWAYPGQAQVVIPQSQLYAPPNRAPAANAGTDKTIALPATASLTGTATDDGLPSPPGALSTTWSRVSGPGTVTFSSPATLNSTASFSTAGTYVLRLTVSDSLLVSTDDVTIVVTSASLNGLTGQYFNDPGNGTHFGTLVLTRVDATVNFSWASGSPAAGVGVDNFSARWTGRVEAPVTGSYHFSTVSDDGIRLWVNGQLVINNWTDHAPTTNTSAAIALTAGVRYTITLEFYERGGGATARLQWSYPGQATQVIPQSRLFR